MNISIVTKLSIALSVSMAAASASAAIYTDKKGNVGYSTMAECNAAIANGTAKFYKSFTHKPPLKRRGEVTVRQMTMSQFHPRYAKGSCDLGVGRKGGRDGVARALQGKYVPYSPDMKVNVYYNRQGKPVRMMMQQCDNWFSSGFPTPFAQPRSAIIQKPVVKPPVVTKPVIPAVVETAKTAGSGVSVGTVVGVVVAIGAVAALASSSDDDNNSTTGTTGTN